MGADLLHEAGQSPGEEAGVWVCRRSSEVVERDEGCCVFTTHKPRLSLDTAVVAPVSSDVKKRFRRMDAQRKKEIKWLGVKPGPLSYPASLPAWVTWKEGQGTSLGPSILICELGAVFHLREMSGSACA